MLTSRSHKNFAKHNQTFMRNFAEAGLMFDYICPIKKDIETGLLWGIYEPEARGSHVGSHRTKSLVGLYISGALR